MKYILSNIIASLLVSFSGICQVPFQEEQLVGHWVLTNVTEKERFLCADTLRFKLCESCYERNQLFENPSLIIYNRKGQTRDEFPYHKRTQAFIICFDKSQNEQQMNVSLTHDYEGRWKLIDNLLVFKYRYWIDMGAGKFRKEHARIYYQIIKLTPQEFIAVKNNL